MIADNVSVRVIQDEFETYLSAGEGALAPIPHTYFQWLTSAKEETLQNTRNYAKHWEDFSQRVRETNLYPEQKDRGTTRDEIRSDVVIPASETAEILEALVLGKVGVFEMLLALTERAVTRTLGADVLIDVETHGRNLHHAELDFSRTVGWFASIWPYVCKHAPNEDIAHSLAQVKSSLSDNLEAESVYGFLRTAADIQPRYLRFNYHGRVDEELHQATDDLAIDLDSSISPKNQRPYLFELQVLIVNGELLVELRYSKTDPNLSRIALKILENICAELQQIRSGAPLDGAVIVRDFDSVDLSESDMDKIMNGIKRI